MTKEPVEEKFKTDRFEVKTEHLYIHRTTDRISAAYGEFAFSHEQKEKTDTSNHAIRWRRRSMILQASIFEH